MGIFHSTYHFYGVHVPREKYVTDVQWRETEFLDGVIGSSDVLKGKGLGHIRAGDYDRDELFLCVVPDGEDCEVELGSFRVMPYHMNGIDFPEWDRRLANLISAVGYEGLDEPGWITVPDAS